MAQKVSEIMTPAPVVLRSAQPVAEAAKVMRDHGIGNVLIVDDGQLKGMVTDRDIVVHAVADARDLQGTNQVRKHHFGQRAVNYLIDDSLVVFHRAGRLQVAGRNVHAAFGERQGSFQRGNDFGD